MDLKEQPLLKFLGCRIKSVNLIIEDNAIELDKSNLEVSMNITHKIDPKKSEFFYSEFEVKVYSEDKSLDLHLFAVAFFQSTQALSEDFNDSPFLKISVPAIVFPYIRSFISTLTVNSGINPIVLPIFNFTNP